MVRGSDIEAWGPQSLAAGSMACFSDGRAEDLATLVLCVGMNESKEGVSKWQGGNEDRMLPAEGEVRPGKTTTDL